MHNLGPLPLALKAVTNGLVSLLLGFVFSDHAPTLGDI
jgi:hypothetical protein